MTVLITHHKLNNMTKEDDKYRQGKSKNQVRASYIGVGISVVGLILLLLYLSLFQ